MKVAIASDLHISKENKGPLNVLSYILEQCEKLSIEKLVIAGDLCDRPPFPYKEIKQCIEAFDGVQVYIVLGNHDISGGEAFSGERLNCATAQVVDTPRLLDSLPVLLLPYKEGKSASQELANLLFGISLKRNNWALISHCDFIASGASLVKEGYFPISQADIIEFGPAKVVLGHIHQPPYLNEYVHYCGSAFALSKDETGPRKFFALDTNDFSLDIHTIQTGPLYWREEVFLFPIAQHQYDIRTQLQDVARLIWEAFSKRDNFQNDLSLYIDITGILTTENSTEWKLRINKMIENSFAGLCKSLNVNFNMDILPSTYRDVIKRYIAICSNTQVKEPDIPSGEIIMKGLEIFHKEIKI